MNKINSNNEVEILGPDKSTNKIDFTCYIDDSDPEIYDQSYNLITKRKDLKPGMQVLVQTLLGTLLMTASKAPWPIGWMAETDSSIICLKFNNGCWRSESMLFNKKAVLL